MRRGWSDLSSALVASAVMAGAGLLTAGESLAAGRGVALGGPGFQARHGVAFRSGFGSNRFGNRGRFGRNLRQAYGAWGDGGWGGGFGVYPGELAGDSSPRTWRDPAICCGPMAPVAIGIRAAPVAPPTTYVVGGGHGFRRPTMNRSGRLLGPMVADSRDAGLESAVDPTVPRVIRLR